MGHGAPTLDREFVTIGEALEAVALSAGNHPVDSADAAAIEAAEKRALGVDTLPKGGLGEEAHQAAEFNAKILQVEIRTTMDDILRVRITCTQHPFIFLNYLIYCNGLHFIKR